MWVCAFATSKFSWLNSSSSCTYYTRAHVFLFFIFIFILYLMYGTCMCSSCTGAPMLLVALVVVYDKIENENRYAATRIYKTVHYACYNQHLHAHTHTQPHNIIRLDYTLNVCLITMFYIRFNGWCFGFLYQKVHTSIAELEQCG